MYSCTMIVKLLSGIVIITFLNIFFLMYTMVLIRQRSKQLEHACSVKDYIDVASAYIKDNKANYLLDKIPPICPVPKKTSFETFQDALINLLETCNRKRPIKLIPDAKHPILTLFTTWNTTKDKYTMYENTLQNWSTFLPKINLVLFTNDTYFQEEASSRGWRVLPVLHYSADGVPVLKDMFKTVMESFNSTYYGFCNGDILFVDNLLETLLILREKFKDPKVFFTGRRTNIKNVTRIEMSSYDNLKLAVQKRGERFIISAEDYFITTKSYPWNDVPAFVVGSPAYDNYLVADSRCKRKFRTIDLTNTVLAVHQTTTAGNSEGHYHKFHDYNHQLLVNMKIKKVWSIYGKGYITCPEYHSIYNLCGDIEIIERKTPPGCKCE